MQVSSWCPVCPQVSTKPEHEVFPYTLIPEIKLQNDSWTLGSLGRGWRPKPGTFHLCCFWGHSIKHPYTAQTTGLQGEEKVKAKPCMRLCWETATLSLTSYPKPLTLDFHSIPDIYRTRKVTPSPYVCWRFQDTSKNFSFNKKQVQVQIKTLIDVL